MKLHIVFTMANNSSAPYFNWFAERAAQDPDVKLSFINLCAERPKMIEDVGAFGCDCYWIPFRASHRKRDMLRSIPTLYKLMRNLKPDVVHSHLFDDALPSLLAARLAGVPIRGITKGDAGFHYYFAPQYVIFDKMNNTNANLIFAISNQNRDFILEKEGADPEKVFVVHHGIPPSLTQQNEERRTNLRDKFKMNGRKVMGTVSRLIEWKGYKHIIAAAEIVTQRYAEALFVFAGTGSQKAELESMIAAKNLGNNIIFADWIDREDIPSFYGTLDVYVHAASMEPFGFVIAEAMMNGAPIVSTRTGAAADAVIHGESGWLTPENDPQSLAEGILFMLDNPEKAKEIAKNGQESAQNLYNFERMYQDHLTHYRNMMIK